MISVIVPTYNEAERIHLLVQAIKQRINYEHEIIVVDGGSSDATVTIAQESGVRVITQGRKGRAAQMNQGAAHARGTLLYFLHADSLPPSGFGDIINRWSLAYGAGCFRLQFDYQHWFLRANSWFTRFNVNGVRFGDQSLFVRKELFHKVGGFREDLIVMEDQEIIHRLKGEAKFVVMSESVITSARRYKANGIIRLQAIFYCIWLMYYLGFSQDKLVRFYKRFVHS